MAWVKDDDRMDDTPKVKRAWRRNRGSVGLWAMAKTYSARHESDGLVPLEWVEDRLPDTAERGEIIGVLLDGNLFEFLAAGERKKIKVGRVKQGKAYEITVTYGPEAEDSYIIHDYLKYNEAREEAEERRRKDAERKTKGRTKDFGENPGGVQTDSGGTPRGIRAVSTSPDPTRPDPTRPNSNPPQPPRGERKRDLDEYEQQLRVWVASEFPDLGIQEALGYTRFALSTGKTTRRDVRAFVLRSTTGAEEAVA